MQFKPVGRAAAAALSLFVALTAAARAQGTGTSWAPFVSMTPVALGSGDLEGGGDYSARSLILRAGVLGDLGGGQRAGVVVNYDYTDYDFTNPVAFGGVAPWGAVRRYGAAAPLAMARSDGWVLGLTPSVDWIHEDGADVGESLTWGGIASATRFFADGNRIGFGLAVFDRLGKTSAFPLLIIDWALSERWHLANPLPAGPTGAAGLELEYRFDGGWNAGFGAAWRSTRFRLSAKGPVAGGVGEESGLPIFLRVTRSFGPAFTLNVYAGLVTAGELRVEDASGKVSKSVDVGTAPLFGATFAARF